METDDVGNALEEKTDRNEAYVTPGPAETQTLINESKLPNGLGK